MTGGLYMLNISFFSYKGGSGRTSLLYNTLPFLANKLHATNENPIVVIDLDIDSKGLSYLIEGKSSISAFQVLKGDPAIGFDSSAETVGKHPLFQSALPIGLKIGLSPAQDASVLFISAHSDANTFLGNNTNFDAEDIGLDTFNRICEDCGCRAIIMDTPTGGQLAADAALSISNKIVTVMRITKQFRNGTYEFLKNMSKRRLNNKEFVIVPNAIPDFSNFPNLSLNSIIGGIKLGIKNALGPNCKANLNMMEADYPGINEVNWFKYEEDCLFRINTRTERALSEDEKKALYCYQTLSEVLTNGCE